MPFVFNGTNITSVIFNGTTVNRVIYNGVIVLGTLTPSILNMTCVNSFDGRYISFEVVNNHPSGATVFVADNSSFIGAQSVFLGGGSSTTFNFYGSYSNPPGFVTFYARAQASGEPMSPTEVRTQNITVCFGQGGGGPGGPGGPGGGFGGF
jgi:hypothetical protein